MGFYFSNKTNQRRPKRSHPKSRTQTQGHRPGRRYIYIRTQLSREDGAREGKTLGGPTRSRGCSTLQASGKGGNVTHLSSPKTNIKFVWFFTSPSKKKEKKSFAGAESSVALAAPTVVESSQLYPSLSPFPSSRTAPNQDPGSRARVCIGSRRTLPSEALGG